MVRVLKGSELRTVDGEATLHITLDLNININADGSISVSSNGVKAQSLDTEKEDKIEFPIPKFENTNFKFGKKI